MNPIKQQKLDVELRMAISRGNVHAVKLALAKGANPALLADNPFVPGEQRLPAFFWAVMSGNLAMVRKLLEMGFDPAVQGPQNENALFYAPQGQDGVDVWDFLVQQGLDPSSPNDLGEVAWSRYPVPKGQDSVQHRTWRPPRPKLKIFPSLRDEEDEG